MLSCYRRGDRDQRLVTITGNYRSWKHLDQFLRKAGSRCARHVANLYHQVMPNSVRTLERQCRQSTSFGHDVAISSRDVEVVPYRLLTERSKGSETPSGGTAMLLCGEHDARRLLSTVSRTSMRHGAVGSAPPRTADDASRARTAHAADLPGSVHLCVVAFQSYSTAFFRPFSTSIRYNSGFSLSAMIASTTSSGVRTPR